MPLAHIRGTLAALRETPGRGQAIVLEEDGAVVGYALLISFWSNEVGGEICVIDELYVDEAYRGRGHAKGLIQTILRGEARWAGIVGLELEVSPENQRARALYEKLGFRDIKNATMRVRRG